MPKGRIYIIPIAIDGVTLELLEHVIGTVGLNQHTSCLFKSVIRAYLRYFRTDKGIKLKLSEHVEGDAS